MRAARPLMSVMVPVRNGAATIGAALRSALTDSDAIQIVVVNDGSTDDTRDVVLSLDDERIVLIDQPARGVNAARNVALDQMTGEWLAMLDADDEWLPGRLAALWSCIEAGDGPLVADDLLIERRDRAPFSLLAAKGLTHRSEPITAAEFAGLDLGLLQPTVRADLVKDLRFPEHVYKTGDFAFWFQVVKRAGGLHLCHTLGYRHHRNPDSVSAQSPALWMQSVAATAELMSTPGLDLTDAERAALDTRIRVSWGRYQRAISKQQWSNGDRPAAVARLLARPSIGWERARSVRHHARVRWHLRGGHRPDSDLLAPPDAREGPAVHDGWRGR